MKNKLISVVMAFAIVFTMFATMSVSVSAADMSYTIKGKNETSETIEIEIGVKGNKGYSGLGFDIAYDNTVLTPVSVEVVGAADKANMTYIDTPKGDSYGVAVYGSKEVKSDGSVCVVTFQKKSTVKDGTTAQFTVTSNDDDCFSEDSGDVKVSSGNATVKLSSSEPTTKKPTTTAKPATTKKPTTTKKATTTKASAGGSTRPAVEGGTLITIPTTAVGETTTVPEETTTELLTEEFVTETFEEVTEYESYSYESVEEDEDNEEDEDEDKSQSIKRIIAIAVIVICVLAVVVLFATKKKSK